MRVTVTRAFLIGGERQEVGTTVDVDEAFARELIAMGKASGDVPPPSGPMTMNPAAPIAGARRGRKANAGQSAG